MGRGNKKNVKRTDTPRAPEEPETPARPQKRTVPANAHAIDHLATRMTNKDTMLSNITDMLSHISEKVGSNTECTGARNVRLGSGEIGPAGLAARLTSIRHFLRRGVMNILLSQVRLVSTGPLRAISHIPHQPHGGTTTGQPGATDQHVAARTPWPPLQAWAGSLQRPSMSVRLTQHWREPSQMPYKLPSRLWGRI